MGFLREKTSRNFVERLITDIWQKDYGNLPDWWFLKNLRRKRNVETEKQGIRVVLVLNVES